MKRTLLAIATGIALSCSAAQASLLGFTNGLDISSNPENVPVNFFFTNEGAADILSLQIDGTTAVGSGFGPNSGVDVFWDSFSIDGSSFDPSIGDFVGTVPAGLARPELPTFPGPYGVNSPILTFTFAPGAFMTSLAFNLLSVDPDFGGVNDTGVEIEDLIGVTVTALFSDNSTFVGQFVDDDSTPEAGLKLEGAVIPLPAGLPLMLAGLGALGFVARRRRNNA